MRKTILLLASMSVAVLLAFLYGCQSDKQVGSRSSDKPKAAPTPKHRESLIRRLEKIMNSSLYRYGEWGLLEVDPSDGHTVQALGPADRMYIPGSATKLFSQSAALDHLGFGHRFKTPVYAQGELNNGTLNGTCARR